MIDFSSSTQCREWFFKDNPKQLHTIGEAKYKKFHS